MVKNYLKEIERSLIAENATEHTHRTAFEVFLENEFPRINAVNEPIRIECGAPDFLIEKKRPRLTIGYIETKDVGSDLSKTEKTAQLKRYLTLPNLILTDFLSFRWYVDGELRKKTTLGEWNGEKIIINDAEATIALLTDFIEFSLPSVKSAGDLARRLAPPAHNIRDIIIETMKKKKSDLLRTMHFAFCQTLVPELSIEDFADMFAQTIAYGLFSSRCNNIEVEFTRDSAIHLAPKSNPFLKHIFQYIAGPQIDGEPFISFVEDIVSILNTADMPSILKNFGVNSKREDPVVHFYETFLTKYDPEIREMRGVYYTPTPVVSYIVKAIDSILKENFKFNAGIASQKDVLVLDPACGTGTFLFGVVNFIRKQFIQQNNAGHWNDYVKISLLPRIFGFELLMAPYAIAHFKLAMQLAGRDLDEDIQQKMAYDFNGKERLGIYLTNTLDKAEHRAEIMFANYLSDEANAAAEIKKEKPVMVVLGNPPYSGESANASWKYENLKNGKKKKVPTFIGELIQDYYKVDAKPLGEKNPKYLQDDYVKFIRWGQWRIEQTGSGILAFITNHGYLDNPTFAGMRQNLINSFNKIYILDLHGNVRKKETAPDGSKDENVFDIQQGTAIAIFVKEKNNKGPADIYHSELFGKRKDKLKYLLKQNIHTTKWKKIEPVTPFYLFKPLCKKRIKEYNKFWKITDIMPVNVNGFKTHRDHFAVDFEKETIIERLDEMCKKELSDDEFKKKYELKDSGGWNIHDTRVALRKTNWKKNVVKCLYRPFDWRYCHFSRITMDRPRRELLDNVVHKDNLCLMAVRQMMDNIPYSHVFVSKKVPECRVFACSRGAANVFPLYIYKTSKKEKKHKGLTAMMLFEDESDYDVKKPNFNSKFISVLSNRLKMSFAFNKPERPARNSRLKTEFIPEDIFYYIYAVLHSPFYRKRYEEFLKIDFPKIPLPESDKQFFELGKIGKKLVELHTFQSTLLVDCNHPLMSNVKFPVSGSDEVIKLIYEDEKVFINEAQYFEPVSEKIWNYYVGGYKVCEKWLKDRKGKILSAKDKVHFQKIISAINNTIEFMNEIDRVLK